MQNNDRSESIFKIKSLIDLFNESVNSIYYPVKQITIDESLILWKGRLSFRQYLKGKAHKYGIKLYILADAHGIVKNTCVCRCPRQISRREKACSKSGYVADGEVYWSRPFIVCR